MADVATTPDIFGVLAEFETPAAVLHAANKAREAGYVQMDAYTPFPVHGLDAALGFARTRVPVMIFIGGLLGCIGGYLLQYYTAVDVYPFNIAGRGLNAWPAFIPITFECTVLLAAFFAVFGMFALNGLPQPYHPLFNVERFERATQDRFFLCIEATDPRFDREQTRAFLLGLQPVEVCEVPS